jgi:hypothetical protein
MMVHLALARNHTASFFYSPFRTHSQRSMASGRVMSDASECRSVYGGDGGGRDRSYPFAPELFGSVPSTTTSHNELPAVLRIFCATTLLNIFTEDERP